MIRHPTSFIAALVVAALLAGCAGFVPQPGPGPEPGGDYRLLTLPFIAVGDTQEHVATGYPLHDNDSAVDAYVEVAQRPPEQTLFGRRLLEWALASHHPDEPFLHLGDVMDMSCRAEADRMARIIRDAPNHTAMLPGNHDGLMFGIFSYNIINDHLDDDARKWHKACRRGAAPDDDRYKTEKEAFSKRDFITLYIDEHRKAKSPKPGLTTPPTQGLHSASWRAEDPAAFLSGIEAKVLDGIAYADSYLAQRIRLPRAPGADRDVIIIGLDTNQAGLLASAWDTVMGRSPGDHGHIHPDQIAAVEKWIDEAVIRGDLVIFAGHHNWRSLGLGSRGMLRDLMARLDHPLVYLSAHTHRGFWAEHRELASQPLLEMNVSSLSDWPLAYRSISFAYDETARRLLVKADLLPKGDLPTKSYADLLAAWEKQACAASGIPIDHIKQEDQTLVKLQRDSRGSLIEWLMQYLGPVCESCDESLYVHAQNYQDQLLETLIEVSEDLGESSHQLHELKLPAWCAGQDHVDCTRKLMAEKAQDYKANLDLFRRKATLVALLNDHLDDLDSHRAKAYMTCRAVQAAKIDFDATDEHHNFDRGEAKRRAEQFFRIEASVGMD